MPKAPARGSTGRWTGSTRKRAALLAAAAASLITVGVPLAPVASAAPACVVAYTGDALVDPGAGTRLVADVTGDAGVGVNRAVTFTLSDGAGGVLEYGATSDLLGRAAVTASVPEGVYGVVAAVAASPLQPGCSTAPAPDDSLLSVSGIGGRLGGSGKVLSTAGQVRFGLQLRTLDDGSLGGRLQLRIHPPVPIRPMTFRAISVAYPPDFPPSPCRAYVVGTGVLDGQAGYTYAVTAVDSGRKATDYFSFVLNAPDGTVLYSSDGLQPLAKGRITAFLPPNPALPPGPCRETMT